MSEKLIFNCTWGKAEPERATLPFLAANIAATAGQEATPRRWRPRRERRRSVRRIQAWPSLAGAWYSKLRLAPHLRG